MIIRQNMAVACLSLGALLSLMVVGCKQKESREPIVYMAVGLETIRGMWLQKGRPDNFDPTNRLQSSVEQYYSYTNEIKVEGRVYRCCFAARSSLVHTSGAMAIAEDGTLLWIYDKDGRVVVSPERLGIPSVER